MSNIQQVGKYLLNKRIKIIFLVGCGYVQTCPFVSLNLGGRSSLLLNGFSTIANIA